MEQQPSNCSHQCYQHKPFSWLSYNIHTISRHTCLIPTKHFSLLSQWTLRIDSWGLWLSISQDSLPFSEKTAHELLSVYLYMKIAGCQESMGEKHNRCGFIYFLNFIPLGNKLCPYYPPISSATSPLLLTTISQQVPILKCSLCTSVTHWV